MPLLQANRMLKLTTPLGENRLLLTGFSGQESISRLFQFRLQLISDDNAIVATDIVGAEVSFSVELATGDVRYFHGVVSRFTAGDQDLEGPRNYTADYEGRQRWAPDRVARFQISWNR